MPNPVPLHPSAKVDPVEIPEVLFISALLDTGVFAPTAYRIDAEDLAAYERVYEFCCHHQEIAHVGPAIDLVQRTYPEFPYVPDVNPIWAADQLHRAAHQRTLRRSMRDLLNASNAGDTEEVAQIIAALPPRPVAGKLVGVSSLDPSNAVISDPKPGLPVPWEKLYEATGGIHRSELWMLLARWGLGKSWVACLYAALAAEYGALVRYVSAEMPIWKVNRRVNLHHARNHPDLQALLRSGDVGARREAITAIAAMVPGHVETIDATLVPRFKVGVVEEACDGAALVVVDHAGLLHNSKGARAIEDWRVMAEISISLQEIKNRTTTPIFAVVQANRSGEAKGWGTPKGTDISQSDQQGMDADVIIAANRPDKCKAMVQQQIKGRDNEEVRWYNRFDPSVMNFDQITYEQAEAQRATDNDDAAGW